MAAPAASVEIPPVQPAAPIGDADEKRDEGGEEAAVSTARSASVVDSGGRVWTRIDHDPPYWHSDVTGESRWEAPG